MSGILCLKWNNHTSTFIKTLDHLRSKELYCDATIACHGKYYPVHRFVLTTCSEYFEEIFERIQCKHPFIIVKDVEEPQLEALLNYMYKGEVNVLQERLPGLIRAAEALKVKGLAVPEDDIEEKKPPKEKRKSNLSSSPLEPKSKRKTDRSHSERSLHDSVEEDDDDDDITEVVNQSSNSPRKSTERKSSKDGSTHFRHKNLGNMESTYQHSSAGRDKLAETEVDDIKIEPNEIFETVDEEFPSNSAAESEEAMEAMEASRREESLFVSLLSPNNTHPASDEEMMTGNEASNQAIPQCSSWSDDVSTNSDKVHDEIPGKAQWLESEEFDQLAMDPYSSYLTNEEESTNFSPTASNESSMLTQGQQPPISETGVSDTDPSKSSIPKLQLSDCSSYQVAEPSDEIIAATELVPKIKEEIPSLESLGLGDTSPSAIAALSKFQFPDCSPNYASLLMEDVPGYDSSPTKLEDLPPGSYRQSRSGEAGATKARFHCTNCSFRCKDKTALKLHIMRKHTGEKPYSCAICTYRCTTNDMLKIHTRKHTGERPFSCPYCSCRMTVKSSLKRHILLKHINAMKAMMTLEERALRGVYLGVDTFSTPAAAGALYNAQHQCPHCDHRTKTKAELLRHVSYYHSDFRFSCSLCHYKCRTNGLLKKHMLKHTKEKPYTCSLCSYKTARKQHLVRHSKLHTGEKPFSCHICSYRASRKDRLREHLRKHPQITDFNFE